MMRTLLLSLLLLTSTNALAQLVLDEDRINNWGAQWANMKMCEDAGYLTAGSMQEMRGYMEKNLPKDTLQHLEQIYIYALQNKVIYSKRIHRWIPATVTPEFCGGYKQ